MATPAENIETPAAEPVVEPPPVETVAATVDETSKEVKVIFSFFPKLCFV